MSQTIRNSTKTFRPTKTKLQRTWYVVDASSNSLGRLATKIANALTGKNRADYSQDVDMGACVVVTNAAKTVLTGMKPKFKVYFRHSGRIGSLKYRTFEQQIEKDPTKVVYHAVKGMLPKNRHQDLRMNNRLYIFADENHGMPQKLETL
jgi:large subunit ribosomal protein L13